MAKAIPEGYHSITPYLVVKGAAKALDWYKENLGAEEIFRMDGPMALSAMPNFASATACS